MLLKSLKISIILVNCALLAFYNGHKGKGEKNKKKPVSLAKLQHYVEGEKRGSAAKAKGYPIKQVFPFYDVFGKKRY